MPSFCFLATLYGHAQPQHIIRGADVVPAASLAGGVGVACDVRRERARVGGLHERLRLVPQPRTSTQSTILLLPVISSPPHCVGAVRRTVFRIVPDTEAAHALGLRNGPTLRLVIVPQAMRVIIPPLTSQYLNLTKNSSLATAIGYPDLVAVFAGTTLNQTGQALEIIGITMATYLTISLVISAFMNWYNHKMALVER